MMRSARSPQGTSGRERNRDRSSTLGADRERSVRNGAIAPTIGRADLVLEGRAEHACRSDSDYVAVAHNEYLERMGTRQSPRTASWRGDAGDDRQIIHRMISGFAIWRALEIRSAEMRASSRSRQRDRARNPHAAHGAIGQPGEESCQRRMCGTVKSLSRKTAILPARSPGSSSARSCGVHPSVIGNPQRSQVRTR